MARLPVQKRVLVVEDDEEMRHLLEEYLAASGFDAVGVGSVPEAERQIQASAFDVVVSDLSLPGRSGLLLLRELVKQREHPKVIVITAFGDWRSYADALSMGASDYMTKPFRMDDLVARIRSLAPAQ